MKRIKYLIAIAVAFMAAILSSPVHAQSWPKVTREMKPGARWWWMGSAVDKSNLTYNLEEYARAGLGAVEITPIYGVKGNDSNEIDYLSPKWMEMLSHVESEGKRLGIEVGMATGTGWPFGGPWVSKADAATKAKFNIDKGQPVLEIAKTGQKVKRAAPGGAGFVVDHLSSGAIGRYLAHFDSVFAATNTPYPHTFFNDSYEVYQADWAPDFLKEFERLRGYKLQDHYAEFLDESRPEVTRRIVSDYRETMGDLLLNNFTRQWTAWAHKHGAITRNQAHGSPANLIDVYAAVDIPECEGFGLSQFNIKGLRQDSLTRKNDSDLSMLKYASSAAHITGKQFTSSETFTWLTEHFRTSLSQCKPDLDLFFVAGINHVFFHGTAYSPKEAAWPGWKFYASVDMSPTNSIWRDAPYFFSYITRCQSFLQKGQPDNDFLVYLPVYDMWNDNPGRLLMFTIHEMGKLAPKFIAAVDKIMSSGYDVDYISDALLRTTSFGKGKLTTMAGTQYKAIVVPDARLMPHDVLAHLADLAKKGATVVFLEAYPESVPGYANLEKRLGKMEKLLGNLPKVDFNKTVVSNYGKGRIITGSDYAATLSACGIAHEEMKSKYGLQYIRRKDGNTHHYFISSLQEKGIDDWVTLSVNAQAAAIFNPMTGDISKAQLRKRDGKTQVYLRLMSGESLILQTFREARNPSDPRNPKDPKVSEDANDFKVSNDPNATKAPNAPNGFSGLSEAPISYNLDHGWKLSFIESEPKVSGTFDIDRPCSWTEIESSEPLTETMATGRYSIDFTLPDIEASDWVIDLGDVRESARVSVNGFDAGCAWAVPYRLNIGKYLKQGENHIDIDVTNLPANRIAKLDREGVEWRKFKEINVVNLNYQRTNYGHWQPMPSGLNGNVKLIPLK